MESKLLVTIDARRALQGSKKLISAINSVRKNSRAMAGEIDSSFDRLKKNLFSVRGAIATLGIGQFIRASVNSFADYETGLVGVGKTTGLAGEALESLGDNIVNMSKRIPIARDELLSIAQAAGQLGISAPKDIEKFTETISKLGAASNLSGDAAATTLARILNNTREPIESVDKLASALVYLGNTSATTEREIAKMVIEISKGLAQFDVASADIAGLGATLSSFGQQPELARSSMLRLFLTMQKVSQEGGDDLKTLSILTGQTGDQFKQAFEEDAFGAFLSFTKGLKGIIDQGGSAAKTLKSLGLNGTEINAIMPLLAKNFDVLKSKVEDSNRAYQQNKALNEEVAVAFSTLRSKLTLLGNNFKDAAKTIGKELAPAIILLSDKLITFLNSGAVEVFAKSLGSAFMFLAENAEILGIALTGLTLLKLAPMFLRLISLASTLGLKFSFAAANVTTSFSLMGSASTLLSGGLRILGAAFAFLTGPIGLAIGAVTAVIGAFQFFKDKIVSVGELNASVGNIIFGTWNVISERVGNFIQTIVDWHIQGFEQIYNVVSSALTGVYEFVSDIFVGITSNISEGFNYLAKTTANTLSSIVGFFGEFLEPVGQVFSGIYSFAEDTFSGIYNYVAETMPEIGGFFTSMYDTVSSVFIDIGESVSSTFSDLFDGIGGFFSDFVDDIIGESNRLEEAEESLNSVANAAENTDDKISKLASSSQKIDFSKPEISTPSFDTPSFDTPEFSYSRPELDLAGNFSLPELDFSDNVKQELDQSLEHTDQFTEDFKSAFTDGLKSVFTKGKDGWKDMMTSFEDIALNFTTQFVGDFLFGGGSTGGDSFFGGDFSSIFGGFFANGGMVKSSVPIVVGERGPELFVPSANGEIIPNHKMGNFAGYYANGGSVMANNLHVVGEKGAELFIPDNYQTVNNTNNNSSSKGDNITINMNISAQDASSFRRSEKQITADMALAIKRARRNL